MREAPRRRSSSSGAGILIVLLLLGAVGVGVWYKFFRKTGDGAGGGSNAVTSVNLVVKDFQAHKDGTQVLSIAALTDGKGLLTSGLDGNFGLWRAPYDKPVRTEYHGTFQIKLIAPDLTGGRNVAVFTTDGRVMLLDPEGASPSSDLFKAANVTALIWPKGGVVAGDAQGRLLRSNIAPKPVATGGARIIGIAARGEELAVATAASEIIFVNAHTLEASSRITLSEGAVDAIVAGEKGVFVIVKGGLHALGQTGLGKERVAVDGNWLAFTGDGALLVAITGTSVSYIEPLGLKVVGTSALPEGVTITALGPAPGVYGAAAGTSRGRLLCWTHQ